MRSSPPTEPQSLPARALGLRPRDWLDLGIAVAELGAARLRLATSERAALLQPSTPAAEGRAGADRDIERVRIAVARASPRLPWRSDCLVQAIAARHWLQRLGVATSLRIGVPAGKREEFEAHAWLTHGDKVITGGDISGYIPIVDSTAAKGRRTRKG